MHRHTASEIHPSFAPRQSSRPPNSARSLIQPRAAVALLALLTFVQAVARPFAATQAPGRVTATSAQLSGMSTPNGSPTLAWFEWGTNATYGQATDPVDVGSGTGVVRVSATVSPLVPERVYHYRLVSSNAVAVTRGADRVFGTGLPLTAWGWDFYGVVRGSKIYGGAVAIGGGHNHALAVFTDGTVSAWGASGAQTTVPADLTNMVAVAGGERHSLALDAEGFVRAWGDASSGQAAVPAGLSGVIAIAAGTSHNLALRADGTVQAWGSNSYGQTDVPPDLSNVVAVAAGGRYSLALKADGTLVAWGSSPNNLPAGLEDVVAITTSITVVQVSVALRSDGTVLVWGSSSFGITNIPADLGSVVALAAGDGFALALEADGKVRGWGKNQVGQCNAPGNLSHAVSIIAGYNYSLAIGGVSSEPFAATQQPGRITATSATLAGMATPNGHPARAWFEWGTNSTYGNTVGETPVGDGFRVARVTAALPNLAPGGVYHYRLVASNEFGLTHGADRLFTTGLKLAAWCDPSDSNAQLPAQTEDVVAITGAHLHSLALRADGSVLVWGNPLSEYRALLHPPDDLTNVTALAGGWGHGLALKAGGTVAAWGTFSWDWVPVFVPDDLAEVIAVAAGDAHGVALRQDGTVVSWGSAAARQRGVLQVPRGLANVVAVSAGAFHTLALTANGRVSAWGLFGFSPASAASDITNAVAITSGNDHVMALLADGTARTWGATPPAPPADLTNVVAISAGYRHSLALKSDQTVVTWGDNTYGQTGPGAAPAGIVAIAGADYHSLTLGPNVPPWGRTLTQTVAPNQDTVVEPPCLEPNAEPMTFTVTTLPTAGQLYQYTANGRGAPITTINTAVADSLGRLIFAPAPDAFGLAYASFGVAASDGLLQSLPGTLTLNVVPQPELQYSLSPPGPSRYLTLTFTGLPDATYTVWAFPHGENWYRLGAASSSAPGEFQYSIELYPSTAMQFLKVVSP